MKNPPDGGVAVERPFEEILLLAALVDKGCAAHGISRTVLREFTAFCDRAPSEESAITRKHLSRVITEELAKIGIATLPESDRPLATSVLEKVLTARRNWTLIERVLARPAPSSDHPLTLEVEGILVWCERASSARAVIPAIEVGDRRATLADLRAAFSQRKWLNVTELQALLLMYHGLLGALGEEHQNIPPPPTLGNGVFDNPC
jgi:hypothetical protein